MPNLPVAIPPPAALALALVGLAAGSPGLEPRRPLVPESRASPLTAAVLYNAARFVTWPADVFPARASPLAVCVLGEHPFGPELEPFLSGKTVANRRLIVRRAGDESQLGGCHVLFVGAAEAPPLDRVFTAVGRGVLTVSDIPHFAERGGMVGFVVERGRVGFEINTQAVRDADLAVSSRLLKLARVVR